MMAEVTRLVCDKCGSEENVGVYRLSTPDTGLKRALALDLCADCAEPLAALSKYGRTVNRPSPPVRSAPRRGRQGAGRRPKIYSQEELDSLEETEESPS